MMTGPPLSLRMRATNACNASSERCDSRIDPFEAAPEIDAPRIEDVARQRDEHRTVGGRGRDLGGAAHDPRQILRRVTLEPPQVHQRLSSIRTQRSHTAPLIKPWPCSAARGSGHRGAGGSPSLTPSPSHSEPGATWTLQARVFP